MTTSDHLPALPWSGRLRWLLPVIGALGWSAEPSAPLAKPPIAAESGDELALFSDLPVVVSASRQQTSISRSPVPVSVLSDEDLAAGGHDRLEEALRFVPGVDVRRVDRNHYAVGIRGLNGSFSDRTVTLIDGRSADSPVFGGAEFYRQPLVMADIDHVEVVRGPGGAAWGANAFNGVINIITKDPEDMLGIHASSGFTSLGDTADAVRWCDARGDWSWKVGAFYERHTSSSTALDDDRYPDNDWGRKIGSDNAVVWRANDITTVRAGLGYASLDSGAYEFLGYQPSGGDELDTTRAYLRLDQQLAADASYRIDWYGNFLASDRPAVFNERSRENVCEAQFDYTGIAGHHLSMGGEWRMTDITQVSSGAPPQVDLAEAPYHEQRYGAFLIDHWQVLSRLSMETQLRGDHYDGTGSDWAGRLAFLYGLDREQNHVLRLATARSYRTPLPAVRDASTARPPFFALIPTTDLENEHVWSLEGGYSGRFTSDLMARLDVYHQRYEDLIGYAVTPTLQTQAQNIAGADGDGGEAELVWSPATDWSNRRARLSTWYAFNHLVTDHINQEVRSFTPADHKVGMTGTLPLPQRFAFTVNYAYTSTAVDPDLPAGSHVGIHHQCDVTLAWGLPQGHGELMVGAWDLFHEVDEPVSATGTALAHETPGRTFFVRAILDF
jgi:outer membrane receptor protein involved in Fe transport